MGNIEMGRKTVNITAEKNPGRSVMKHAPWFIVLILIVGCAGRVSRLQPTEIPEIKNTMSPIIAANTPSDTVVTRTPTQGQPVIVGGFKITSESDPSPRVDGEATSTVEPVPTMADVPPLEASVGVLAKLGQPASIVRDGIIMTVKELFIYRGRIELLYTVQNIPQAIKFDDFNDSDNFRCHGPVSYPRLEYSDGIILHSAPAMPDGRAYNLYDPFIRYYAVHVFYGEIPVDVDRITFSLDCIGLAKLNKAPLGWKIPLHISR